MVQGFHVGDRNDASFYAGILISAFSLAEAASGMFWGGVSDRIGRKPVLLLGCCGTVLSLLMVGFSKSFTFALCGRIAGGLLNGNIGVIQTMVGELIVKPEWEPKAYAVMPFVWSIGTIIGPAIGGTFANPIKGFPDVFSKHGFFAEYPWALPNLICAGIMFISIIGGYFCLKETHPDFQEGADPDVYHDITETTPMISAGTSSMAPPVDIRRESFGTFNSVAVPLHDEWTVNPDGSSCTISLSEKSADKWFTYKIAMLVAALGIYTYHSMCYDHLLPIFLQDDRANDVTVFTSGNFRIEGGLGLPTKTVGLIMSVNGMIALLIQAVIFPVVAEWLGVFRTFMMVTILHPLAFFIVPYLVLLPSNLLFAGIYSCLTIRNVLSILDYPVLLIMLKQASPAPRYLGKINGLAASVGAASRMIAPPIAGLLYGWGSEIRFSGLAWFGAGLVALVGVCQLFFVPREQQEGTVIKSVAPCFRGPTDEAAPKEVINVHVVEEDVDVEGQR